ncbi:MAG: TauD/TfdA family dioxygenase [Rhodospirillales bacterium]
MSATIEAHRPAHGIPPSGPSADETASLEDFGGIEIADLDLSRPLTEAQRDRVMRLFRKHPVLVFRGQNLTKDQQYTFTLNFGEIEGAHVNRLVDSKNYTPVHTVSNLDADGNPSEILRERGNYYWHSDKSYHAVPSLLTMLHAVELPPKGGETQFANTAKAYSALPQAVKAEIEGLRAIHSWEASRIQCGGRPATPEQIAERPPVDHPLVRVHPDSGDKALYLGNHASHIVGRPTADGQALLRTMIQHVQQPQFVYTHRWQQGDLVLWDNRCSVHRALPHEAMGVHRRVLHRTVVKGSVPY